MAQLVADNVQSWKLHAAAQAELGNPVHYAPVAALKAGSRGIRTKCQVAADLAVHRTAAAGRHNLPMPHHKKGEDEVLAEVESKSEVKIEGEVKFNGEAKMHANVEEGVGVALRFDIFDSSDAEGSTTDESSGVSEHAGRHQTLTTRGVDVQTELSFPEHALACQVTSSADQMVLHGLAALAWSSLDAVSKCRANVDRILQGAGTVLRVLGATSPTVVVIDPASLVLSGPPPTAVLETKMALTRFKHAVLIYNSRAEARRDKRARWQRSLPCSEGVPYDPCGDGLAVAEAMALFTQWCDEHKEPSRVRMMMREWFQHEGLHVLASIEEEVLGKMALVDAPFRRRVGNVYHSLRKAASIELCSGSSKNPKRRSRKRRQFI
jgi:hypothetical protein